MNAATQEHRESLAGAEEQGTTLTLLGLIREAIRNNADASQLSKLTDLYERDKAQQRKASFLGALRDFRSLMIPITRDADGQLDDGKDTVDFQYATLANIDTIVTPILARLDLTYTWDIVEQSTDWVRVRCRLSHVDGFQDEAILGGPPDDSGGKSKVQAISSTVSALERLTLIAVLGLSTRDQDASTVVTPGRQVCDALVPLLDKAANDPTVMVIFKVGRAALTALRDTEALTAFRSHSEERRIALRGGPSVGADEGAA